MRLARVQISNFRNFRKLDVQVGQHAVIVGENKVGKSNFLTALRLVLDPSLPDTARVLRPDDFSDCLPRPLTTSDRITISIDFSEFMESQAHTSLLADALVDPDRGIARLTYTFRPKLDLVGPPVRQADYEYCLYMGAIEERGIPLDVRRRMPLDVLPALRDAEGALANWRTSPLRPLIDELASQIERHELAEIANELETLSDSLCQHERIKTLEESISQRLASIVGMSQSMQTQLGFAPTDPDYLLRSLRLFIDGRKRAVGEASLGSANLLYLTLRQLELERLVQSARDHTFFAIEEPEAHLHPQLQRLVYREYLRPRLHMTGSTSSEPSPATTGAAIVPDVIEGSLAAPSGSTGGTDAVTPIAAQASVTKILTTHSPHIVSVSPIRSLVLLRRSEDGSSHAISTADLDLSPHEEADLERYLDVTRGEIVFARGVLLVEGEAETYLLPAVGRMLGYNFDQLGISVCSVAGVHFEPYLRFIGPGGLDIAYAVLTDNDPQENGVSQGRVRARRLYPFCRRATDMPEQCPDEMSSDFLPVVAQHGIFLNDHTIEIDLYRSGQHEPIAEVIHALSPNGAARQRASDWGANPSNMDPKQLLTDIVEIGKGRFAQRLASCLRGQECPPYIRDAIEHVAVRCR